MNFLHAILLGLVQGITEYLPVSANGHVIILGNLLGEPADLIKSFGVALQAAPALAVLALYWRRFENIGKIWKLYALGVLPVLITGFLFKKYFYGLMLDPWPSVLGLAVGGLGILLAEARHQEGKAADFDGITALQALGIGLFQCLALWPGISRSGATIIGGLLLGLNRKAAAEFSFLIGVPVFLAAAALEFHKSEVLKANLPAFGCAFAASLLCAVLTVSLFMKWLGRISFKPFGWYRLALSPLLWALFR